MNTIKDASNEMIQAAKDGAATMREMLGQPKDPHVATYEKMTPEILHELVKQHGHDAVADYVKRMEIRRMKGA